jgi:hypothetical protein
MSSEDTEGERQIEMTWRCSSCSNQNLGRFKQCQKCGDPKDGTEQYEMPADPSSALSVTEESLLKMALGGPDWRCAYCGSDQLRAEGTCGQCGASVLDGLGVSDEDKLQIQLPAKQPDKKRILKTAAGLTAVVALGLAGTAPNARSLNPEVTAVTWEHVVDVERYALREHEGFRDKMPADAFDLVSLGDKVHHHEEVLDHYDTEIYYVDVPDGYRSERYTERVSCGEDCTDTAQTCSEKCRTNNNGFATCQTTCSGGGRRCTTRYCSESRTREVPKTRSEQRSRQVPKYRSEPRYAEAFRYKVWDWAVDRTTRASGTDVANMTWPSSPPASPLHDGEKEREQRHAKYRVTVTDETADTVTFEITSPAELAKFPLHSKHVWHLRPDQQLLLDDVLIKPIFDTAAPAQ